MCPSDLQDLDWGWYVHFWTWTQDHTHVTDPRPHTRNVTMANLWIKNQLTSVVEDQGFLHHLEFLNPRYARPSRHYMTLTPLLSYNMPVCALVSWVSCSRPSKTGNWEDGERVWKKERSMSFLWWHKKYEKIDRWFGDTERSLHCAHTPHNWLYTRVCCHSAVSQTHLLMQGRW